MDIKRIDKDNMKEALDLVWKTFLEYEAPDYSEEGINAFKETIDNEEWINERELYGAYLNNELVGVIGTKDKSHIALFFVDGKYHKQGIGRKLFEIVLENNDKDYLTVNSSIYAKEIYEHLGFKLDSDLMVVHGLKFYPMTMKVNK